MRVGEGDRITARHAPPVKSLRLLRGRIFGHPLGDDALKQIIRDIVAGRYSAIEISAFITACAAKPAVAGGSLQPYPRHGRYGERLVWRQPVIVDKHSVGGLPGNRTTPIIVAICAALGLTMPKTSSRAITSPAGTADMMETLAPVALDEDAIRAVVEREGGCIAWGGAVSSSPADDILIRIERALDIDSEGQMIASVLSKKIAAGATHLVIDMPVGPTAKVRSPEAAQSLGAGLLAVAHAFGIRCQIVPRRWQPAHRPRHRPCAGSARRACGVEVRKNAPQDLRARALALAGALLELSGRAGTGDGVAMAAGALDDGRAWAKFQAICDAQGGLRTPPYSKHRKTLTASVEGRVVEIDNRRIARLAKLAGAPGDKAAGLELHVRVGDAVTPDMPLCTVHAEAIGELAYALSYADANVDIIHIAAP